MGDTPDAPDAPDSVYTFAGWGAEITAAATNAEYTAAYSKEVNLARLSDDYVAQNGDKLVGTTTNSVRVVSGTLITFNGVQLIGVGGAPAAPEPQFGEGGQTAATQFVKGADGKWTLVLFAELSNDAIGAEVVPEQIKVRAADTLEKLKTAEPLDAGVDVKEIRSAVKTVIEITPPAGATNQFFKAEFGK